ncbi:hypothetical protein Taro_012433 [Colocasia esculenta]|uniref:Protein FAR1-RELATED SEQUENCE n=1 Tax=Colocasia esculenta TaxID=4460 RepID=A0A843U8Q9_COLES|nr:hypothetical protein [Colocasia esculenta]
MDPSGGDGASAAAGSSEGYRTGAGEGGGGSGPKGGSVALEPWEGMEFGSCEEATGFYYEYAGREGFRVTRKSSHRSKRDKCLLEVQFVCSRYGKKREKPDAMFRRYSSKMDCRAAMFVRRKEGASTWFVHHFVRDHNHELETSGRPQLPRPPRVADDEEARTPQTAADAPAVLEFFSRMQLENLNFFYAFSLDDDQRLKNVFWVDAKARHDYTDYGDAVLFDAGCVSSKFRLPLATISGVNNHGSPLLFGCALLADKTESSFVWFMQMWLRAMGGQAPKAITLDQHDAIKAAAKVVFPCSRCRFCTRHIRKKVSEKLGNVTQQNKNFMENFDKCLYKSLTDEKFERKWSKMIEKFGLHENEMLQSLYEDRRFWVPTYLRETGLWAVISSAQSEGSNSYFGKHVSKKTTLKEFVDRYESDLHDRYEKESTEYFRLRNTEPELKSPSPYELQMSLVYTGHVFEKFQVELLGTRACQAKKEKEEGPISIYWVKDLEENREFMVSWNRPELKVSCLCCLFEFKGYLCRHALIVLQFEGVPRVPSHYILNRWTKDARNFLTLSETPNAEGSRLQRYNRLCHQATRLAHDCSISEEGYSISLVAIEEARRKFIYANGSNPGLPHADSLTADFFPNNMRKRKQTENKNADCWALIAMKKT